ncbi:hypothetical protein llg_06330 [Luteolibacter sp. LG18]|nr:hypothetical protein llg_06330 [Luteolibacter sp. LG18]
MDANSRGGNDVATDSGLQCAPFHRLRLTPESCTVAFLQRKFPPGDLSEPLSNRRRHPARKTGCTTRNWFIDTGMAVASLRAPCAGSNGAPCLFSIRHEVSQPD